MYVKSRFVLNDGLKSRIYSMKPEFGFGKFGEIVFYRTYSRTKPNGKKESWNDVVIRVIEGTFSIRKDWYIKNNIEWDESFWQHYAWDFGISLFNMSWLPPGRGLWAMGTDYVYERGSMCLNNCGFTIAGDNLGEDMEWLMDSLMCGVGVGFRADRNDDFDYYKPLYSNVDTVVPDSREGWAWSTKTLIDAFLTGDRVPRFEYKMVRDKGLLIKGFGGISSGPEPLIKLHQQIEELFRNYDGDSVKLKVNLCNRIGCAVVSGNVRRSAELGCAPISDPTFLNLKDYDLYPERAEFGWMSNNSVLLETKEDFLRLKEVAERVVFNGEPGIINLVNLSKGRIGKNDNLREDKAIGFNPCGEQPLEDKEVCCLAETLPTRVGNWFKSCEYATMYASTISLLPTHSRATNKVVARNRRIGVSIVDVSGWTHNIGTTELISNLRQGYDIVRETNRWVNGEAGIPEAIRVTTIKPGGTTPKIAGKTGGFSWPTFDYTLFRIKVAKNSTLCELLDAANIHSEQDLFEPNTLVYELPALQGPAQPVTKVSLWEQAAMLQLLQREWADNAVSNTLYFKPAWVLVAQSDKWVEDSNSFKIGDKVYLKAKFHCEVEYGTLKVSVYDPENEEHDVERVLASTTPMIKSLSLLPHTPAGVYPQMPQSQLTKIDYDILMATIGDIDWDKLKGDFESTPEKYCEGDKCVM